MLIDDIIVNILILLFIGLILYLIAYAVAVFSATKKKQLGLEQKYLAEDLPGNLIVVIYAKRGQKGVVELVNMLKLQKYPKENYQIHVVFDNFTDEYPEIVEQMGGVKVWRINKGTAMGKDKALSWLLERLISFRNVNAFVFLDSNRVVKDDFLSNINIALFSNDVIVSAKEYVVQKGDILAAIYNVAAKYYNRIFNTSRAVLKLICPIDSGAVAIKQEVLEKMQCVDFKDKRTEYMYSLFLASKGYVPVFAPDVRTKIEFGADLPLSLSDKISIFKYGLGKVLSNWKIGEYLLSTLRFPALAVIFLYLGFFVFLYHFEVKNMFFYDIKYITTSAVVTLALFVLSLLVSADEKINPIMLCLYPVYKLLGDIFPTKHNNKQEEEDEKEINSDIPRGDGETVMVSDGENMLKCTAEVKNTGDGKKIIFRYKSKTLVTNTHSSVKGALDELSEKMQAGGLRLHVCGACAHFGFKPNTDISSQVGLCSEKNNMTEDIQPEKHLFETCDYFCLLSDLNNVIDFESLNKDNNNQE